ncbi:MAG: ornithine cyclodeaminase family protein [Bacteroidota bacterium]
MSRPTNSLVLSKNDIQEITQDQGLDRIMDLLIERLEEAMKAYSIESISMPARSGFNYEKPHTGLVEWMPIYEHGGDVTIKIVGYHPDNPRLYDLPTIVSTISAYDTATGHLLGLMDGVLPTAIRTGAATAIATKYMAKADSKTLGLIGCGAQSVTQLHGISRVLPIERVLLYDIQEEAMISFAQRVEALRLDIEIIPSDMAVLVAESDVIVTATSIDVGAGPLFNGISTRAHAHVNAIGSDFPGKTELPLELLKKSFICADFLDQAIVEGECQQLDSTDIDADIVGVVTDPRKYEFVKTTRSVYDSTGWALQDKVTFSLFMELAHKLGMGQRIAIENMSGDASNPYDFMRQSMPMELRELEVIKSDEN